MWRASEWKVPALHHEHVCEVERRRRDSHANPRRRQLLLVVVAVVVVHLFETQRTSFRGWSGRVPELAAHDSLHAVCMMMFCRGCDEVVDEGDVLRGEWVDARVHTMDASGFLLRASFVCVFEVIRWLKSVVVKRDTSSGSVAVAFPTQGC